MNSNNVFMILISTIIISGFVAATFAAQGGQGTGECQWTAVQNGLCSAHLAGRLATCQKYVSNGTCSLTKYHCDYTYGSDETDIYVNTDYTPCDMH